MKPSAIFTKKILGIDLRVWQTMLITLVALIGFGIIKFAFFNGCANLNILVNNQDVTASKYLYANKPIVFKIDAKDTSMKVIWSFTKDGITAKEKGNPITHIFREPGEYEVTALINKKCKVNIKLELQQPLTSDNIGSTSTNGNPINGLDQATSAQSVSYFCDISATTYLWKVLEDPSIQPSTSNMFNPVFLNPGLYTIELALNNDLAKTYKKTVVVTSASAMPTSADMPMNGAPGPVAPISPNLAPPSNANFNQPKENKTTEQEEENEPTVEVKKKKDPLFIPDQELKYQLTQIGDKKASILDLKPYFCDGYETTTKVQVDGKIISLTELCDKLQSKKGLLRGKPKLESVKIARDPDSKCIIVIYADIK